jgi:hypothetical protein
MPMETVDNKKLFLLMKIAAMIIREVAIVRNGAYS